MQYPRMGNVRPYRISIPQLNGGVNVSVPPHLIQDNQLSDAKNMWYKDGCLKTRPSIVSAFGSKAVLDDKVLVKTIKARDKICGIFYNQDKNYVFRFWSVDNEKLTNAKAYDIHWERDETEIENILAIENNAIVTDVNGTEHGDVYVLFYVSVTNDNGDNFYKVFGISPNEDPVEIKTYAPTIIKGGEPQPENYGDMSGALFEPYNLLSNECKFFFTTNSNGGKWYVLGRSFFEKNAHISITYSENTYEINCVASEKEYIIQSEKDTSGRYVLFDTNAGAFKFVKNDDSGMTVDVVLETATGGNNVEVHVTGIALNSTLHNSTASTWFGGGSSGLSGGTRLFVAGNDAESNVMRWSSLNNPLYFPENNYAYVGADNEKITAFGKQSDMLVIFKEKETYFSYYVQGEKVTAEQLQNQEVIDTEAARALFPVYQLHPNIGCDLPNTVCLCNNRLVWFNRDRKAYGLFTSGLYSERNVRRLSDVIDDKLQEISDEDIQSAFAYEFDDHYLVQFNRNVFVMDYSSNGFSYYSSYSSDEKAQKAIQWYCWDLFRDKNIEPLFVSAITYNESVFMFATYIEDDVDRYTAWTWTLDPTVKKDLYLTTEYNIFSTFATKLFDFGYPERYKRINPFYLHASGEDGKTLNLTYLNENGAYTDACSPTLNGEPLEKTDPRRISPNAVRVREFGIKVECDGYMEVGSLVLNYAMMGTVR